MRTLLCRLGIVAGVMVTTFVLSITNAGQAIAQGVKPILTQVINTADSPVPVVGSMQVNNTAAAPVMARDLGDIAARSAFSEQIRVDVAGFALATFTIPPGERLVVECVSVWGFDSREGGDPDISLLASVGEGPRNSYRLTPVRVEPSGVNPPPDVFAATQLVRFYADTLSVSINFGVDTTNTGSFIVTVSGYLVDQP